MTGPQEIPGERVREALEEVLSEPPFPQEPGPLQRGLQEFFEWLTGLFSSGAGETVASAWELSAMIMWILLISLVVVFIGMLIHRALQARRWVRSQPELALETRVRARVAELREEARQAEEAGDYTLALRLYFFALVIGLGQQGQLEYKEAWTNRELLERGEPGPDVLNVLRPLVGELDAHSFGERKTEPGEVRHFAQLCERMLVAEGR